MKHIRKFSTILLALALLAGQFAFTSPAPAKADPVYTCLPTCEETDARMLTIVGSGLSSLSDEDIELQIAVDAGATSFEVGFFDGETGGVWDTGTTPLKYSLYADPLVQGDQSVLVGEWLGSDMPDNAWFSASLPTAPAAQSPGGNYFYFLKIESSIIGAPLYQSNFKVRTDGLLLTFRPSPFAFQASLTTVSTAKIVYPQYPLLSPTTYDGTFALYFYLSQSTTAFITWDGDLDHGDYYKTCLDTDDPDTPNEVPAWANPLYALPEGVAVGYKGSTGNPNDDNFFTNFQRSPCVNYTVTDPNGNDYLNANPSGNSEWEQFTISSDPNQPADVYTDTLLSAGVYRVTLQGMDLGNLNAWRSLYPLLGVCQAADGALAQPCKDLLFPFLIGDTVFYDADQNGVQDSGEPGLPGVLVNLLDSNGSPVLDAFGNPVTATTDSNGSYQFQVEGQKILASGEVLNNGLYTVQVAPENFQPGGVLEAKVSTTGGDQQTNTDHPVIDANVLSYDFGYRVDESACTIYDYNRAGGYAIVALNPQPCLGQQNGLLFHGTSSTTLDGKAFSNGCLRSVGTHTVTSSGVDYVGGSFGNLGLITPDPVQVSTPMPKEAWYVAEPNCSDPAAHQMKGKDFKKNVVLDPGLWCISGDVTINAKDTLIGDGVTLYFLDGRLRINGKATVQLSAPKYGAWPALQGILFYFPGENGSGKPVQINGTSDSFFSGVVYAPGSEIEVLGIGYVSGMQSQFIGWDVRVGGTADILLGWQGSGGPVCTAP